MDLGNGRQATLTPAFPLQFSFTMRILIQRIDLLFTGLTSLSVALSLAIDNGIMDGLPHRPSGMETASVEASQLGTQPYWSVDALVNGQNVTLMVDTGSSDL